MVRDADLARIEILPDFSEYGLVAALIEFGCDHFIRIGLGCRAGYTHLSRRPQAQQPVAPGIQLKAQFLIMNPFGFVAFFPIFK